MQLALLLLSLTAAVGSRADNGCDNYCVGVRGNGEAEPAHPAALARLVEDYGMPKSLAGGSSATVTMFLADQVKANPKAGAEVDAERKRKLQALLLKSMPEFEAAMTKDAKVQDAFGLMKAMSGDTKMKEDAIAAFSRAGGFSPKELKSVMAKYGDLLNPELVRLVEKNPVRFGPEAVKSVKNLGKFNAVTDDTLFFRPGLVDFKGVALVLGYMGDFYAGNVDPDVKARLDSFLDSCADSTYHKEWMDAPEECRTQFQGIAADYLKADHFANKALFQPVSGESLPGTAVLQGDGVTKYLSVKHDYETGKAKNIGDFSIDFNKDIAFGYWGNPDQLAAADQGLEKYREQGDAKAKKFRGLGQANWFEVLSTSPAEPGIANAQEIPFNTTSEQVLFERSKPLSKRWKGLHYRKDVLSIGGWSDLHPTTVLKTQPGCDRVIYLTRHADYGDSVFGQQVFIRLTGTKKQIPFWDKLAQGTGTGAGWCDDNVKAAGGDPDVVRATPWSQISNLCNPQSSFRRALDVADATACTDWDNAKNDVFQGQMRALVKDAYESPVIPTKPAGMACEINAPSVANARALPGCLPYTNARQPGSRPTPERGAGAVESAE